MATQLAVMVTLEKGGAHVFDYGNNS